MTAAPYHTDARHIGCCTYTTQRMHTCNMQPRRALMDLPGVLRHMYVKSNFYVPASCCSYLVLNWFMLMFTLRSVKTSKRFVCLTHTFICLVRLQALLHVQRLLLKYIKCAGHIEFRKGTIVGRVPRTLVIIQSKSGIKQSCQSRPSGISRHLPYTEVHTTLTRFS